MLRLKVTCQLVPLCRGRGHSSHNIVDRNSQFRGRRSSSIASQDWGYCPVRLG
jgi:hypothetical protein